MSFRKKNYERANAFVDVPKLRLPTASRRYSRQNCCFVETMLQSQRCPLIPAFSPKGEKETELECHELTTDEAMFSTEQQNCLRYDFTATQVRGLMREKTEVFKNTGGTPVPPLK